MSKTIIDHPVEHKESTSNKQAGNNTEATSITHRMLDYKDFKAVRTALDYNLCQKTLKALQKNLRQQNEDAYTALKEAERAANVAAITRSEVAIAQKLADELQYSSSKTLGNSSIEEMRLSTKHDLEVTHDKYFKIFVESETFGDEDFFAGTKLTQIEKQLDAIDENSVGGIVTLRYRSGTQLETIYLNSSMMTDSHNKICVKLHVLNCFAGQKTNSSNNT
jgi:hypothetical protein